MSAARDHRGDGRPLECLVYGVPLGIALWVLIIGAGWGLVAAFQAVL